LFVYNELLFTPDDGTLFGKVALFIVIWVLF